MEPFGLPPLSAKLTGDRFRSFEFFCQSLSPRGAFRILLLQRGDSLQRLRIIASQSGNKFDAFIERSFYFFHRFYRGLEWLASFCSLLGKPCRLLDEGRIGFTIVNFKIRRNIGTVDSVRERLQAFRHKRFTKEIKKRLQRRLWCSYEIGIL